MQEYQIFLINVRFDKIYQWDEGHEISEQGR